MYEYLAHWKRVAEFVEIARGQLVRQVVLDLLVREALAHALRTQATFTTNTLSSTRNLYISESPIISLVLLDSCSHLLFS